MRELLKQRGTIYVHVGRFVSQLVKLVCDDVFGRSNFINEVTWKRSHAHGDTGQGARHFGRVTEALLIYGKSQSFKWNPQYVAYSDEILARDYKYTDEETGERYRLMPVDGPGGAAKGNPHYEFLGVTGYWRYSKATMQGLYERGEVVVSKTGKSLSRKRYLKDAAGTPVTDLSGMTFNRISPTSSERLGFETQKPESLLERVILTSSEEGDLVGDLFCGSGTTGAVAERLGRRWVMADLGSFAIHTSRKRLIELQRALHTDGSRTVHSTSQPRTLRAPVVAEGAAEGRGRGASASRPGVLQGRDSANTPSSPAPRPQRRRRSATSIRSTRSSLEMRPAVSQGRRRRRCERRLLPLVGVRDGPAARVQSP